MGNFLLIYFEKKLSVFALKFKLTPCILWKPAQLEPEFRRVFFALILDNFTWAKNNFKLALLVTLVTNSTSDKIGQGRNK